MSKWGTATAKERESAPASVFCGPHNSFPVADREDYNNAIRALGRAGGDTGPIKACIRGKAKSNGWPLPESWMSARAPAGPGQSIAAFALGDSEITDGFAIRRGKLFEAGTYEDKDFAATIEDLYVAASLFQPVNNDLEHMPTVLDGKLGRLTKVELADDGSLVGEVEIPQWLDEQLGESPVKTSLMWDRESMEIVGNALVLDPRIPDAQLVSAFTAFSPPGVRPAAEETADPVGLLATIKALLLGQDPRPKPAATVPPVETAPPAKAEEVTVADAVEFKDTDEYKAMQTQIAQLLEQDKQRAAREAARDAEVVRERAGTWADAEIASFRSLPAERADLIAAFVDAATDDAATPRMVRFSTASGEETEGSRVEALRARHAALPQHMLTQEQMRMTPEQLAEAGVLFAQRPTTSTETMNKARHDELITLSGFSVNTNN